MRILDRGLQHRRRPRRRHGRQHGQHGLGAAAPARRRVRPWRPARRFRSAAGRTRAASGTSTATRRPDIAVSNFVTALATSASSFARPSRRLRSTSVAHGVTRTPTAIAVATSAATARSDSAVAHNPERPDSIVGSLRTGRARGSARHRPDARQAAAYRCYIAAGRLQRRRVPDLADLQQRAEHRHDPDPPGRRRLQQERRAVLGPPADPGASPRATSTATAAPDLAVATYSFDDTVTLLLRRPDARLHASPSSPFASATVLSASPRATSTPTAPATSPPRTTLRAP